MNKKIVSIFFAGVIFILSSKTASAIGGIDFGIKKTVIPVVDITVTPTPTPTTTIKLINPNLIKKIDFTEYQYKNKRSELKNVKVTEKTDTYITVDSEGVSIKVLFQANTHYRRRYWGKSSIAEISVGNYLDIIGRWNNEEKTEIKAVVIRNNSIQKRYGVFFGTINKFTDTGFVMTTTQRGEETVTIEGATIINRIGTAITKEDLQIGHKIRVKGLWDSANFTITEVAQIKDFSLPPIATPTPEAE